MAADTQPAKLKELILYILERLGPDVDRSPEKIQTIIYLADLEHFHKAGKTISGGKWLRQEWGVGIGGFDEAWKEIHAGT